MILRNKHFSRIGFLVFFALFLTTHMLTAASADIDPVIEESLWVEEVFKGKTPLSWESVHKNRKASPGLPSEGTDGMNIPASHSPLGFVWNEGDVNTKEWYPQGISGKGGTIDGNLTLLVSWYHKHADSQSGKGARITLVDYHQGGKDILYRHILLVQDKNNGLYPSEGKKSNPLNAFAPVDIHAGGVAWHGEYLYVVDTKLGIRVFHTQKIFEADMRPDDPHYAFQYKYVLPQIGYYRTHGTDPNSFISVGTASLENGSYVPSVWTGNYLKTDTVKSPRLFGYLLNTDGTIDTDSIPSEVQPKDKDGGLVYHMQGAYRSYGETYLSVTGKSKYKGSTARLITQKNDADNGKRWRWPHGAEDLYLDDSGFLWSLTEHPPESQEHLGLESTRMVFGVDLSTY